jgi:ATP-dependent Clp protease ATP-binding subunit ClpA
LEKRQLELDATNTVLRQEITKKFEERCNNLNKEVEEHQEFVLFQSFFSLLIRFII